MKDKFSRRDYIIYIFAGTIIIASAAASTYFATLPRQRAHSTNSSSAS